MRSAVPRDANMNNDSTYIPVDGLRALSQFSLCMCVCVCLCCGLCHAVVNSLAFMYAPIFSRSTENVAATTTKQTLKK